MRPQSPWKETVFEVTYDGPTGYDPVTTVGNVDRPGYRLEAVEAPPLQLEVNEMPGWTFAVAKPERVGERHWRFRGSDLTASYLDPKAFGWGHPVEKAPGALPRDTSWTVQLMTSDARDLPQFSRGPNTLQVKSRPVGLCLP